MQKHEPWGQVKGTILLHHCVPVLTKMTAKMLRILKDVLLLTPLRKFGKNLGSPSNLNLSTAVLFKLY